MANAISLITRFNTGYLDEIFRNNSKTIILEKDNKAFKFTGAHTIKIPKIMMEGLEDYSRTDAQDASKHYKGYAQGSAGIEWETFELTQDRAKQFRIDSMDDEETAAITLGNLLDQFMRTQVVPEIDAYRFSKIIGATVSTYKVTKDYTTSTNAEKVLTDIINAKALMLDEEVPEESLVMFVSNTFDAYLQTTPEVTRLITQGEFKSDAGLGFQVKQFNGMAIMPVPAKRLMSAVTTAGSVGYIAGDGAVNVNFIIVSTTAVIPVKKHEISKLFGPEVVQDFDGSKLNYRIYHDIFFPKNKTYGIYTSLGTTSATGLIRVLEADNAAGTATGTTVFTNLDTRGVMYNAYRVGTTDIALDGDASALPLYVEGANFTPGTDTTEYVYGTDSDGMVTCKSAEITVVKKA